MDNNYKKVKHVLWIILFANFGIALLKIIVGTVINSSSMTADGFHSISDGTSNIVGIIGIALASKPEDKEHPYGHERIEYVCSMIISFLILIIAYELIAESITKIV